MTKPLLTLSSLFLLITISSKEEIQKELPLEKNNLITSIKDESSTEKDITEIFSVRQRPTECTRNYPQGEFTSQYTSSSSDISIPQHCLEVNCGLGIYTQREDEVYERCSFCNSIRPKN